MFLEKYTELENCPPQAKILRIYDFWPNLEQFSYNRAMVEAVEFGGPAKVYWSTELELPAAGEHFEDLRFFKSKLEHFSSNLAMVERILNF